MSLRINANVQSLIAHHNLQKQTTAVSRSMEKLSSGLAISSAKDDPAGLAISEKMRAQLRGLQQAQRNAGDGISLVQTADSALGQATAILQRIRELAVQYNNGAYSSEQRAGITTEVGELRAELERIGSGAKFMEVDLLSQDATFTFQVGANADEIITLATAALMQPGAGLVPDSIFDWTAGANLAAIDQAVSAVSNTRAGFGAVQNRLEQTMMQLATFEENLSASESQVRDVDAAAELMRLTQSQMRRDANLAMMAQGNVPSDSLRRLLE